RQHPPMQFAHVGSLVVAGRDDGNQLSFHCALLRSTDSPQRGPLCESSRQSRKVFVLLVDSIFLYQVERPFTTNLVPGPGRVGRGEPIEKAPAMWQAALWNSMALNARSAMVGEKTNADGNNIELFLMSKGL